MINGTVFKEKGMKPWVLLALKNFYKLNKVQITFTKITRKGIVENGIFIN